MKLQVQHQTDYHYTAPVSLSVNQLCLTPRNTQTQACLTSILHIIPEPEHIDSNEDRYGNSIDYFSLEQAHETCSIVVESTLKTADEPRELVESPTLAQLPALLTRDTQSTALMAHDCLLPSLYIPVCTSVDDLIGSLNPASHDVLSFADALMQKIFKEFTYDPSFSTLVTPIEAVLTERKGVCQDFAHLAIAALRRVGIPARYVSGYLETLPPPGMKKLKGADASHAWYSVYVPTEGWFDFDPTNNRRPDGQYITTAWGRDYGDVAPLKGVVFGGGKHTLEVSVDVNRVEQTVLPV